MRQPTIHQMRKKNHRGKVKEVETFHYFVVKCNPFQQKKRLGVKFNQFLMMTKTATLNTIHFPQPLSRLNCVVFSDFAFLKSDFDVSFLLFVN
jgi:hypothetical protein